MKAAPNAKLDDGLFDIIIVKGSISRFQLVKLLTKIFTGEHIKSNHVEYLQAKKIDIIPETQESLNVDGEIKGKTPVSISIIPNRIRIFY